VDCRSGGRRMFVIEPYGKCPYHKECSGYVGGITCVSGNYWKCDRYKLSTEADECYENMKKILEGLNNGKKEK